MIEYYTEVRLVHIACVVLSGALFALRGTLRLAGVAAANHALLRYLSYAIDTALLTAALMLSTMLRQYPFVHAWLTVKVLLLVAYIVAGSWALKRAHTARGRALAFAGALALYLAIVGVARTHHPLGWWHLLAA
jgi:uncharacterized membrane protein SirB2